MRQDALDTNQRYDRVVCIGGEQMLARVDTVEGIGVLGGNNRLGVSIAKIDHVHARFGVDHVHARFGWKRRR